MSKASIYVQRQDKIRFARGLRQVMTRAERILWEALRARRFHGIKFRRQVPVGPHVVDFLSYQYQLIIEVDGKIHLGQEEYDQARDYFLMSQGFQIIHITNEEVFQSLPSVLTKIEETLYLPV